jgi:hypothetical protein
MGDWGSPDLSALLFAVKIYFEKCWNFVDKRVVVTDIYYSWLDDHLDSGSGFWGPRRMKPSRPRGWRFFFFLSHG